MLFSRLLGLIAFPDSTCGVLVFWSPNMQADHQAPPQIAARASDPGAPLAADAISQAAWIDGLCL